MGTKGSKNSSVGIEREAVALSVTIDDTADGSGSSSIDFTVAAGGAIQIPSGSLITAIDWLAADTEDGDYLTAYESDGTTAVTQTVSADGSFIIPDTLYGKAYLKPVATFSSGSVAETITIVLKS